MASWSAFRGVRLRELDKKRAVGGVLPELDFHLDAHAMRELAEEFREFPGAVQQAILLATDRTRQFTRNEMVRGFRRLVTLKPAYIGKGLKSSKAKPVQGGARAEVRIATSNIPLGRYGVKPERPPRLKGVPVAARQRVSYRLRLGGQLFDDAPHDAPAGAGKLFVQAMSSGHIGVFYRHDGAIQQEFGPSLQYHAYADGFLERISRLSVARFRDTFSDEARKLTGVKA